MELHNFGLHNAGTAVHLIEPDAAALTAFGPNLMAAARRAGGARAGLPVAEELRPHGSDLVPRGSLIPAGRAPAEFA